MTEQPTEPSRTWARGAPPAGWGPDRRRDDSAQRRILGGAPLVVGALLMWLNIRPADVYRELSDLADRLWALGFQSVRDFGAYIVAGAIIVVPVWLVLRLFSYRGR